MPKFYYLCKYTPCIDGWDAEPEYCVVHAESKDAAREAAGKEFCIGKQKYEYIEIWETDIIEA